MNKVTTYQLSEEERQKYLALPTPKKERPSAYTTLAPQQKAGLYSKNRGRYYRHGGENL